MTTARHSDRMLSGRRSCGTGVSPARGMGRPDGPVRVPPMEPKAETALGHTAKMTVPRRGFSLAELVLALGILAIGLTMAAALFPAAIKLNELSTHDSIGTIIATNGLAITRSVVHEADVTTTALRPLDTTAPTPAPAFVANPWLLRYPATDPATLPAPEPTTRGYLPLGRRIEDPPGTIRGYQLVIVAYDKYAPGSNVTGKSIQINAMTPTGVVPPVATLRPGDTAAVGSPLIVARNGNYAKIVEFNPSSREAVLDHEITVTTPEDAFVIEDDGAPGRNCVMLVLVAETLLNP